MRNRSTRSAGVKRPLLPANSARLGGVAAAGGKRPQHGRPAGQHVQAAVPLVAIVLAPVVQVVLDLKAFAEIGGEAAQQAGVRRSIGGTQTAIKSHLEGGSRFLGVDFHHFRRLQRFRGPTSQLQLGPLAPAQLQMGVGELVQDVAATSRAQRGHFPGDQPIAQADQVVAHVDRLGHAVLAVQRRAAVAELVVIFNVVVYQRSLVQSLDRQGQPPNRQRDSLLDVPAAVENGQAVTGDGVGGNGNEGAQAFAPFAEPIQGYALDRRRIFLRVVCQLGRFEIGGQQFREQRRLKHPRRLARAKEHSSAARPGRERPRRSTTRVSDRTPPRYCGSRPSAAARPCARRRDRPDIETTSPASRDRRRRRSRRRRLPTPS